MNFSSYLAGSAVVIVTTVAQPTITLALEATQIKEIADNIMVRIDINNGEDHGSGVIIARDDSNYYVLTSRHVVQYLDYEYTLTAPDGENYYLDNSAISHIEGVDMAVVRFQSDLPYKIAQIERSKRRITPGIPVYINGFPKEAEEIEDGAQFTSGSLTGMNEQTFDGYNLVYSNFTRGGMSGGPVLNEQGRLIGIHGLAAQEKIASKPENNCSAESSPSSPGLPPQVGSASQDSGIGLPTQVGADTSEASNCVELSERSSEKINLNLGISIFTFLERADAIGMGEVLDTTAGSAPQRPTTISPNDTTGTSCSGVTCP